jgi:hypothetical protein
MTLTISRQTLSEYGHNSARQAPNNDRGWPPYYTAELAVLRSIGSAWPRRATGIELALL